ncbi:hypothetical protein SERLADRAFT_381091 [Serpula lacrymans var. lacrymans S7.9]|uniref:Uncharacterized protein n=1 Tax=Serpula lacrymans var. lacrymans (strain S7.9) TaxID=578457 RepID=F8NL64_SERL9|nr:uncharacterized protein SERLADRAFT_381091 [Serpula lacrymans var. lacrymans S7.9]EGO28880.1 hypothetical protein SERLADRAFT_381091 [Serpula lacrymans var. lacrymans S7.9]
MPRSLRFPFQWRLAEPPMEGGTSLQTPFAQPVKFGTGSPIKENQNPVNPVLLSCESTNG